MNFYLKKNFKNYYYISDLDDKTCLENAINSVKKKD